MPKKTAMEVFNALARKANADSVTTFQQVNWLRQFEPNVPVKNLQGKCYAFAIAYLMVLRSGGSGADYIATLDTAASEGDHEIRSEIYGGDYVLNDPHDGIGQNYYDLQHSDEQRNATLREMKLYPDGERTFDQTFFRFTKLAEYVSAGAPAYCLINAPNHAMASTATPVWDRGKYTYFDPNFGEAVFSSQSRFKTFVSSMYSHQIFNKGYRRKEVGQIVKNIGGDLLKEQVAQTKSLLLTAQRFRETIN